MASSFRQHSLGFPLGMERFRGRVFRGRFRGWGRPFPLALGEGGGSGGEGLLSSGDWAVVVHRLRLSMREVQIICLIVTEQKDRAIALELGISYNTLLTQLSRLYRKLGVQTRVGVMVTVFSEALKIVAESQATSGTVAGGH